MNSNDIGATLTFTVDLAYGANGMTEARAKAQDLAKRLTDALLRVTEVEGVAWDVVDVVDLDAA